jgi:hypothetical protein
MKDAWPLLLAKPERIPCLPMGQKDRRAQEAIDFPFGADSPDSPVEMALRVQNMPDDAQREER